MASRGLDRGSREWYLEVCSSEPEQAARYEIGTGVVVSDRPFPALSGLRAPVGRRDTETLGSGRPAETPAAIESRPVELELADQRVVARIAHHRTRAEIELEIRGHGRFRVSEGEIRLWRTAGAPEPWDRVDLALAGPVLIAAMALRGDFCWHASAVAVERLGAFVFLGDSGAGKSTLAARLADGRPGWSRVADDLVLIRCGADPSEVAVLPRFPQPKLTVEAGRRVLELPQTIPIRAILVVEKSEGRDLEELPVAGAEAIAQVVEHSVATRLFGPETLARHLDACTALVRGVRCARLRYPHRPEVVEEVRQLLLRSGAAV